VRAHARSTEITASIVEDTRREVAEVASINDREPVERRACVAGLGEAPFRVSFEPGLPPEEAEDEGPEVRFRIDPSQYIAEYYAQFSFFTSLDTREHVFEETGCGNLPPAVLSDLEGTPYEIGLLKPLHDALHRRRSGSRRPRAWTRRCRASAAGSRPIPAGPARRA